VSPIKRHHSMYVGLHIKCFFSTFTKIGMCWKIFNRHTRQNLTLKFFRCSWVPSYGKTEERIRRVLQSLFGTHLTSIVGKRIKKYVVLYSAGSGQQPLVEYFEVGHEIFSPVWGKEIRLISLATIRFPIHKPTFLS